MLEGENMKSLLFNHSNMKLTPNVSFIGNATMLGLTEIRDLLALKLICFLSCFMSWIN